MTVRGPLITIGDPEALASLAKPDPLIDNHAPRGGDIVMDADAEVWATETQRQAALPACAA